MTIVPLTEDKRIDTDEYYPISDLDAEYVIDEKDVWSALMGAIHESESALNISRITDRKKLITKRYVSVEILMKSFPLFFKEEMEREKQ